MLRLLKILCSIPILLLALYYVPFLGICLLICRFFIYRNNKKYNFLIILLVIGLLFLVPRLACLVIDSFKLDFEFVSYIKSINDSSLYNVQLIKFSKLLITVSIIFLVLTYFFRNVLFNKVISLIKEKEAQYDTMRQENDYRLKDKAEKAKKTKVITCKSCGSTNIVSEKVGRCTHCRGILENSEYDKE